MANAPGWFSEVVDGAGSASIATPVEATDPAEGSAISVHVYWQPEDGNEPSVTDTEGNTYELEASVNGANRRGRCFVATDIVSGPDFQVLVTWATAQFALGVAALEVVGADPTDAAGVAGGQYQGPGVTTGDGTTTGTLGTPAEDGHLVHASSSSNSWPDSYEEESALTELGRIAAPGYLLHGYRVQGTAAAVSASFTQDSTASTLTLATSIKPAGGGGGTETPQSVDGAIAPSGTLTRQVIRALAGGAAPTGTLTRRGSRTIAGASTPSGTLARRTARSVAGALSSAGALVRRAAKLLAAGVTPTGTVTKRGTRTLAGATTPTGALSAIRAVLTSVAGAVVLAGTVTARLTRAIVAAIAPSGAITKRTAASTGGTIAPIGAVAKRHPKAVVGAITPGGLVWRRQGKPLSGAVTPAATLATQLNLSADLLQLTFVPAVGPRYTIRYPSLSTVLTMTSFAPEFIPLGTDAVLQLRGVKVFNPPTGTRVPATGITITAHLALTPTGDPIHATLQLTLTERAAGEWYGVLQGSASEAHLRALLGTLIYVVLRVGTDDYLGHFPVRVVDGVPLGA